MIDGMLDEGNENGIICRPMNDALIELLLHPQLDAESEAYISGLVDLLGQVNIAPMNGTRMICTSCHSINAIGYKLKRSGAKYQAFCVDENGGCAGKEITPPCSFADHMGIQCDQIAEYQVNYGNDRLLIKYACVMHVGILLGDSDNLVTPLK